MLEYNEFTLSLIRHGQSTTNENPDLMGQLADTPLSEKGKLQAALLGGRFIREKIDFDYIFSSSYTRAFDTAKISTKSDLIIVSDKIREYDAGDWVGASRSETLTPEVKAKMAAYTHGFLPPNGESLNQVERRASAWLEEAILYNKDIIDLVSTRKRFGLKPLNIACFSHGMTIKCLLHYIMGFDKSFTWKLEIENTSISTVSFGKEGWRLTGINDYSHLK
jgi:broad specificity phosphatase PhoE